MEASLPTFPLARLDDFHVGQQDRFGVLALHVHASHGGERSEILFPSDHERTISKAMEQVRSLKTMERDAAIAARNVSQPKDVCGAGRNECLDLADYNERSFERHRHPRKP